jgi:hypothetical protein
MATTPAKREKERARLDRQRQKEQRREQRKVDKANTPRQKDGEDPDIAGIVPGPQPPLEEFR